LERAAVDGRRPAVAVVGAGEREGARVIHSVINNCA
jgi:hypothetical protein